ncbi:dihydrodipicolinate reductase [Gordonia sp. (in: high G+C Gram-positive bacteria)]|uniref:NAD(P)H-dependent amine dehydrogenase family protein n=1 Tax=Gordonia sp. (in: high G+C Gram-positive bacteria) TaxID=84139 RepID=UPI001691BE20|nr:dihydrodipicolinate reductase [Gordonia sp. (in: high G+C Gram-positive bacteria)]NLG45241.1 dihydrodipicolinate reductase [Gordonia sp. (in: high G+C Gram-positive bacteria)]
MANSSESKAPVLQTPIPVVVWGTGNVGRAAIRAVAANPLLQLTGVIVAAEAKADRDAGDLAGADRTLGVRATRDVDAALETLDGAGAVVYAANGELRPDEAVADIARALAGGAVVVSPSVYALYDHRNAPAEVREPVERACAAGESALFVSGIDPGWGNDLLPVLVSGLGSEITQIRCQEIFDYSTYDAEDSVRYIVGMGQPMDYDPPMVMPGVPSMVWGGQIRLIARALGVELDELREVVDRQPLTETVTTALGEFVAGGQGALRFEVQGIVGGEPLIVVEHVTRITGQVATDWPMPADGGDGAHRVIVEGRPRIEINVEATDEGGNRSAGGNATAANRLVNAIPWLRQAAPGLYDGLDVPLAPSAYLRQR